MITAEEAKKNANQYYEYCKSKNIEQAKKVLEELYGRIESASKKGLYTYEINRFAWFNNQDIEEYVINELKEKSFQTKKDDNRLTISWA